VECYVSKDHSITESASHPAPLDTCLASEEQDTMGRAPCCDKMGVKKGPWTLDEDQILVSYINKHGHGNWRALPKQAGLLRCGKSCRLRWTNYLRPDLKRGNFSPEEEDHIIKLHQLIGNRWSTIASYLPGRTDNEIKNVWSTRLKKRLSRMKDKSVAVDAQPAPSSSLDSSTEEMAYHGSNPLSLQILCNSDARAPSAWEICDPIYVSPEFSEDVISSSYKVCTSTRDYQSTSSDSTLDVLHSDCIDSLELKIDHSSLSINTVDELECQPLSRDPQIFIANDRNNFEDPAGLPAIARDDKAEMVTSIRPACDGEIIISDESLNSSINLQVDSPMQQFYGAEIDWLIDHADNMSPAMDSNRFAINTNQLWSADLQVGEGMDYWLNILKQVEPLPLFQLALPSQSCSPIFTTVEH